jgi:hypothetical protein
VSIVLLDIILEDLPASAPFVLKGIIQQELQMHVRRVLLEHSQM